MDCYKSKLEILRRQLPQVMLVDRYRLRRKLSRLAHQKTVSAQQYQQITQQISDSIQRYQSRQQHQPQPKFEQELPVISRKEDIAKAISQHQVTIISGETGSGKTTQIPQICLQLGLGCDGLIGHTQPRRIAARTVASRIAQELDTTLGDVVGYKVRFHDSVSADRSYIKLMTDGILLAETQQDPYLNQYRVLIIDEAHERSLNIDFLLGYLKQLLPKRPDLKLIITSATINTARFSDHFNQAPIIEVSGRSYPVEIRYRPLNNDVNDKTLDMTTAIINAAKELYREGIGDILVFLSGERDIRDMTIALEKSDLPQLQILPLFARQSATEQNKVFKTGGGRRIILATNVAETSLTVPGIRYVIDTGYARISRYSVRHKVQRLPIEKIAQSSANQRSGRCGRIAAGIAIRLYDEAEFIQRPAFTEPEILRTNLAAVILQMAALKLGQPSDFPFIDPPQQKMINDGLNLLKELQAVTDSGQLTTLGRQLAQLPIDPRIGRMLLAANTLGCVQEVLIIASALSIQDPRERPLDNQQAADEAHQRYQDNRSDFLSYLNLWQHYQTQRQQLSQNKLRQYCQRHFLSFLRLREWSDIYQQLLTQLKAINILLNTSPANYNVIHQALLTGLLSHIAQKNDNTGYLGARQLKLKIFPGSALFKKKPKWLAAAELVDTGQLYARTVAKIEPEWLEQLASHLVRKSYSEPHWRKKGAQVVAYEQVSLYGLAIIHRRLVHYGKISPTESREIFIRAALVAGDWDSRHDFFLHNHALIEKIQRLENKARRRDILVDDEAIFHFYQQRIPENIVNGSGFNHWYRTIPRQQSAELFLSEEDLMQHQAEKITTTDFPEHLCINQIPIPIDYQFEPGRDDDGICQTIPLALLNQANPKHYEWLVPGLLREKLIYLVKTLPKAQRKQCVPAPHYVDQCLKQMSPEKGDLLPLFSQQLALLTNIKIAPEDWRTAELPDHLHMHFKLVDDNNTVIDESRDLALLQKKWGQQANLHLKQHHEYEKTDLTTWCFGTLEEKITLQSNALNLVFYPSLIDRGSHIDLQLIDNQHQAQQQSYHGLKRLFAMALQSDLKYLNKIIDDKKTSLYYLSVPMSPYASTKPVAQHNIYQQFKRDLLDKAIELCFLKDAPIIRTKAQFEARLHQQREQLIPLANRLNSMTQQTLSYYQQIKQALNQSHPLTVLQTIDDIKTQLNYLIYQGFINDISLITLNRFPIYCQAILARLTKLKQQPQKDQQWRQQVHPYWQQYLAHKDSWQDPAWEQYRWMIEEFRISLFAQELKTHQPISAKRLDKQLGLCR